MPLIVAAAGESADEYARVVAGLEAFGALVEINISSPNTKLVYEWSSRPAELGALFRAVRAATAKPIIVKVSPDFRDTNEERIIPAALDAGITIVNCGNTRRVDEPRLSQRTGGLSGPALFRTTSTTSAGFATDSARSSRSSPPAASTRPTRRAKRSTPAPPRARISPAFITRGPILARLILDHAPCSRAPSAPGGYPRLIHLSTGVHRTDICTLRCAFAATTRKSDAPAVHSERGLEARAALTHPMRCSVRSRAHDQRRNEALTG